MSVPIIHTNPATGLPVGTTAAFLTLGSALVALFTTGGSAPSGEADHDWLCLGCGERGLGIERRRIVRNSANIHAATCRAIPLPTTNA
ncbi:hypothetical protein ABZ747_01710 [Kitasatospora cineracea]|uniref:hypothetical protein n=1 Tax=Kitasatospora cineracea TaxID=88074 RepID=UPI0033EED7AD